MPIIAASRVIRAPQERLFDISQDYELRKEWDPFVRELEFLDQATSAAPGVKVRVQGKNRLTMVVEYIAFQRPERVAIKMIRGPGFFEHFAGTWAFAPRDPAGEEAGQSRGGAATEVRFRYSFALAPGWARIGAIRRIGEGVITRVFRRDIEARLAGLARYAESKG